MNPPRKVTSFSVIRPIWNDSRIFSSSYAARSKNLRGSCTDGAGEGAGGLGLAGSGAAGGAGEAIASSFAPPFFMANDFVQLMND